jgi:acetyltransferase-like isoleucine patch superfamily enzyme/acyl carrier protein
MGGIGLAQADFLARTLKAKLALVGRTSMPDRDDWTEWLRSHEPRDATSRKIRKLLELEALGAQVLALTADVTDEKQMKRAIDATRERFGSLDGVIHAAGALNDAPIALKSAEDAAAVLAPKVEGALVLERLLQDRPPEFLVLFSSTSSFLGAATQIDYVAANSFLNALAESRAGKKPYTVAVNWGIWSQVGMAAELARQMGVDDSPPEHLTRSIEHPLLDKLLVDTPEEIVFSTEYSVERHWILDQHRIKGGEALIPGTGYLEIARAALEAAGVAREGVRIEDLFFIAPLEVKADEVKEVHVTLHKRGANYEFSVTSRSTDGEGEWREHARGRVGALEPSPARVHPIDEIARRCTAGDVTFGLMEQMTRQEEHLDFGPRWKNIRRMRFGAGEALGTLELAEPFHEDLKQYRLHPALMDLATGFALPLLDDYETCDDLFVPISYERLRMLAPLTPKIHSYARLKSAGEAHKDIATFDIAVTDERGVALVEIEGFSIKRIRDKSILSGDGGKRASGRGRHGAREKAISEKSLLELGVSEGIRPVEGALALKRVLSHCDDPLVIVSSIDLDALIDKMEADAPKPRSAAGAARPAGAESAAPRDSVEAAIARCWGELLGVERIGINDDFFDLGGHSLLGIRVTTQLNQQFGTTFPAIALFDNPTVAKLADLIRKQKPELAQPLPGGESREAQVQAVGAENQGFQPGAAEPQRASQPRAVAPPKEAAMTTLAPAPIRNGAGERGAASGPSLREIVEKAREEARRNGVKDKKLPYRMRRHWFCHRILLPLYRVRSRRLRDFIQYLTLKLENGEWFSLTIRDIFERHYDIKIGHYSGGCFEHNGSGRMKRGTRIGKFCSIYISARVETANHPVNTISSNGLFYQPRPGFARGIDLPRVKLEIGNDVWLGHNSVILYPTSRIGNGAVVGAGAVVAGDVPDYAIVSGYPATIVRYRFSEAKRRELLESKWWECSLEELAPIRDKFIEPLEGERLR